MAEAQETAADITAKMRNYSNECNDGYHTDYGVVCEDMRNFADRLDAAIARERGNVTKLREALRMVRDAHYTKEVEGELYEGFEVEADDGTGRPLICVVEDALAAPPRNCDRFDGDIDKLREACARERGLNPEEDFPDVFPGWLLALSTEKEGGAK